MKAAPSTKSSVNLWNRVTGSLPVAGNRFHNFTELLATNITQHNYYKGVLVHITSYSDLLREIQRKVHYVQPHLPGSARTPSSAFCILYRLADVGLTRKQLTSMMAATQPNPFVRALAILYVRYLFQPQSLWDWLEPCLNDHTNSFVPADKGSTVSFAEFTKSLVAESKYYRTLLPRIPVPLAREYKKKMIVVDMRHQRARDNERIRRRLVPGTRCRAEYVDPDTGEADFYDAIIDAILPNGNFSVSYVEYGNEEEVDIGAIQLSFGDDEESRSVRTQRRGSRDDDRHCGRGRLHQRYRRRSHSPSHDRKRRRHDEGGSYYGRGDGGADDHRARGSRSHRVSSSEYQDLDALVREQERRDAVASGRQAYSRTPVAASSCFSVERDRRTREPSPPQLDASKAYKRDTASGGASFADFVAAQESENASRLGLKSMSAEAREQQDRLRSVYGDASSTTQAGRRANARAAAAMQKEAAVKPVVEETDIIRL